MIELDEDSRIAITVIYSIGAVMSIWAAIFSGDIFAWMGVKERKQRYKTGRDWPTRFLVSLIAQPITFVGSAIALWWYACASFIPPVHLSLTIFCLFAYDFNRDDEPWEKGWDQGGRHR